MTQIVLTEDQARLLRQAQSPIRVCDSHGTLLGHIEPLGLTTHQVQELKRRAASSGPWFTGEQVRMRLDALQDAWDREGGFGESRMRSLLNQMRSQEPQ